MKRRSDGGSAPQSDTISRLQSLRRHVEASSDTSKPPECGCLTSHATTHGLDSTGALHTALTYRMHQNTAHRRIEQQRHKKILALCSTFGYLSSSISHRNCTLHCSPAWVEFIALPNSPRIKHPASLAKLASAAPAGPASARVSALRDDNRCFPCFHGVENVSGAPASLREADAATGHDPRCRRKLQLSSACTFLLIYWELFGQARLRVLFLASSYAPATTIT